MPDLSQRIVLSFILLFLVFPAAAWGQELKAEEIIERHIAALGGAARLAEVKTRIVAGTSSFRSKLPNRQTAGKAIIASDPSNLMFLTSFASNEYPMEKIGYFNGSISLPWVTAGTRSPLGAYLADHEKVLSGGLFGGAMSSSWALIHPTKPGVTYKAAGTRKVDGKRAHVLEYLSKGIGSQEFTIRMYFDADSFNHIRTEYRHEISSSQDTFGQLGRQAGVKISLTEIFSDFKEQEGLTFPYGYRAEYRTESNSGTYEYVWGVQVGAYNLNQPLAADFFTFEGK